MGLLSVYNLGTGREYGYSPEYVTPVRALLMTHYIERGQGSEASRLHFKTESELETLALAIGMRVGVRTLSLGDLAVRRVPA